MSEDKKLLIKEKLKLLFDRDVSKEEFLRFLFLEIESVENKSFDEGKDRGILETKSKYAIVDENDSLPTYLKEEKIDDKN